MSGSLFGKIVRYFPASVIPTLAGLLLLPLVTRVLGPEGFGQFSLIQASIGVSVMLGSGWLSMSVIRFHPEYQSNTDYHEALTRLTLLSSGFCAATFLGFATVAMDLDLLSPLVIIVVVVVVTRSVLQVFLQVLRSEELVRAYTVLHVLRTAGSLVLVIPLLLVAKMGVDGVFLAYLVTQTIALAFLLLNRGIDGSLGIFPDPAWTRRMVGYGLPLVVTQVFVWIIVASDRFIVEHFEGVASTGVYSAGYMVGEAGMMIAIGLFTLAMAPASATVWIEEGREAALRYYADQVRALGVLILPLGLVLILFGVEVLTLIAGDAFVDGEEVIIYVVIAMIFHGLQWIAQRPLNMINRTRYIMWCFIAGAGINVSLNLILVPHMGFIGAAIATMVSYISLFSILVAGTVTAGVSFRMLTLRNCAAALSFCGLLIADPRRLLDAPWFIEAAVVGTAALAVFYFVMTPFGEVKAHLQRLLSQVRS